MERINYLFQEWNRLGGDVLLLQVDDKISVRPTEQVIAESIAHCRDSSRLTWVLLGWLVHHVENIDAEKLLRKPKGWAIFPCWA